MKYAYANVEYKNDCPRPFSHLSGRWVATIHDGSGKFFISDEQSELLELNDIGIYTFLVKFDPDDQFATIITPEKVAEITSALDDMKACAAMGREPITG